MGRIGIAVLLSLVLFALCVNVGVSQDQPSASAPDMSESGTADAIPSQTQSPPAEYRLRTGDMLRIIVWGEPNFSNEQMVDPQGYISMSIAGPVLAEGVTGEELTGKITEALRKYLDDPKVQVSIIQFDKPKVHLVGQLNRPGLHEFKPGDKVMEAIALAGSFTEAAFLEEAKLTRKGESISIDLRKLFYEGDMSQNLALEDGDTIYIPEDTKNKYYVLGEVLRPGMYRLREDVTVIDAVSIAGGPTPRGSLKGTCVVRGEDVENSQRIKLDVSKLIKTADMSQNIKLQAGDVVFVPETSKPNWQEIAGIISGIVNASYLFRIWGL